MRLLFADKTTDGKGVLLSTLPPHTSAVRAATWDDLTSTSLDSSIGTPTTWVDDVQVTTRVTLRDAINDGAWHVVEVRNANLSAVTQFALSSYGGDYNVTGEYAPFPLVIVDEAAPAETMALAKRLLRASVGI